MKSDDARTALHELAAQMETLVHQRRQLDQRMTKLETTIWTLIDVLAEAGLVEEAGFHHRLRRSLDGVARGAISAPIAAVTALPPATNPSSRSLATPARGVFPSGPYSTDAMSSVPPPALAATGAAAAVLGAVTTGSTPAVVSKDPVKCTGCGREVPADRSYHTEWGEVCESCFRDALTSA